MSLLCFIFIGSLIGWLAAILTRTENAPGIRRDIGFGLVGALFAGLFMNNWAFLGGLSWTALGASIAGSVVLVTASKLVLNRTSV